MEPDSITPTPIFKETAKIGDDEGTRFSVLHSAAPNVTTLVYRAVGGEVIRPSESVQDGLVIFSFATPPGPEEFIAVVIG